MKSTKAMRDRIRELMPKAWDDYDRAVYCVLEDLETSLVRIEALEAALRERDVDIAFCREAMRHADIDLTVALPMLTAEMQRSARKTLDRLDEAKNRSLAPEQNK